MPGGAILAPIGDTFGVSNGGVALILGAAGGKEGNVFLALAASSAAIRCLLNGIIISSCLHFEGFAVARPDYLNY